MTSWIADVDKRTFPLINVRRLGGTSNLPNFMDSATIEMTAFSRDGIVETENLLLDARQAIWDAVDRQTVIDGVGYLHSYFETMGPTQFDSPFDDTWRIQSLTQLGLRPIRI